VLPLFLSLAAGRAHTYAIISADVNRKEQYLDPRSGQARSAAAEEARSIASAATHIRLDLRVRPDVQALA
jgi:hypothetical protein